MQEVPVAAGVDEGERATEGLRPLKIAQVLLQGSQWGAISPDTIEKGLGGRETAVIKLGEQWAMQGHEVVCFVPTGSPSVTTYPSGGRLEFISNSAAQTAMTEMVWDVVVSWEAPMVFDHPATAKNIGLRIVGMQVAHLELDPEQVPNIDKVVVLSDWAKRFLNASLDYIIPIEKFEIIPNGVDLSRYPYYGPDRDGIRRKQSQYFYSSSPDRGLHHILKMWRRVRKEIDSHAVLHVAYGVDDWVNLVKWSHNIQGEIAREVGYLIKNAEGGIINHGKIGQSKLAYIQANSCLLPYTCDTFQPTETGCITVVESMAAMCPVLTTDCDSLAEQYSGNGAMCLPLPVDHDEWLGAMDQILRHDDLYFDMQERGRKLAESRTWTETAKQWQSIFHANVRV